MKRIINRTLIVLLIIVLLFEFSFSNTCHAAVSSDTINKINNLVGGIVSIIIWIPKLITTILVYVFNIVATDNIAEADGSTATTSIVTPFDIFFNHYKLLDINVFDIGADGLINSKVKKSVAQWFYVVRNMAAAILLVILIYVGIRMALSTVASEKARYSKMFYDWVCSLILIFVLQYIGVFLIHLNNAIVKLLEGLVGDSMMSDAIDSIFRKSLYGLGVTSIMAFIVYIMISVQTILFLIAYLNRLLKVSFLVIISPLISVTYSIDKMGDGKAQALEAWLKEFIYTILIQPFDCIMYLAFVEAAVTLLATPGATFTLKSGLELDGTVNEMANGVLAILCLKFINDGEKAIRKIFNFQDDNSSTGMAAGAALAVMAVQKAQKAGGSAKKFIGKDSTLGKAVNKDWNKIKGSNFAKDNKLGQAIMKASDKTNELKKKFDDSKFKKVITAPKKLRDKVYSGKGIRGKIARKATSFVVGAMGAAMLSATGAGGMESFAAGRKLYDMKEAKLYSSIDSASGGKAEQKSFHEEEEYGKEKLAEDIADIEQELQNNGVSQDDMDDTDSLKGKAEEAEKDFEDAKDATPEGQELKEVEKQLEEVSSEIDKLKDEPESDEKAAKLAELKKREKELSGKKRDLEEKLDERVEKDESLKALKERSERARRNSDIATKRKELMKTLEDYDTDEAKKIRALKYARKVSSSEFKAQEQSIMSIIAELTAAKRMKDGEEVDSESVNEVMSEEDLDSAERTTQRLIDSIKYSVKTGSNFDISKFISKEIGLESDRKTSMGYFLHTRAQQLERAAREYRHLEDRQQLAELFGVGKSFGIKEETMRDAIIEKGERYRPPREKKPKKTTEESGQDS